MLLKLLWKSVWIGEQGHKLVSSVQSLSCVRFFATPWTAARQASLSITNSRSLPKLMSIESVMPSNHLTLCRHPFLLPSVFPSIRVFSNESVHHIRWPKYWSFSFKHQSEQERTSYNNLYLIFQVEIRKLCELLVNLFHCLIYLYKPLPWFGISFPYPPRELLLIL